MSLMRFFWVAIMMQNGTPYRADWAEVDEGSSPIISSGWQTTQFVALPLQTTQFFLLLSCAQTFVHHMSHQVLNTRLCSGPCLLRAMKNKIVTTTEKQKAESSEKAPTTSSFLSYFLSNTKRKTMCSLAKHPQQRPCCTLQRGTACPQFSLSITRRC